jgi:hypothetical protein
MRLGLVQLTGGFDGLGLTGERDDKQAQNNEHCGVADGDPHARDLPSLIASGAAEEYGWIPTIVMPAAIALIGRRAPFCCHNLH